MPFLVAAFAAIAALIFATWSLLGAPVPMPAAPLGAGEKLHCISYAPFHGTQSPLVPGPPIPPEQIDRDLAELATITDCVRTYSVDFGLDGIPALARKHGLKVLMGLWLSRDAEKNRVQIDTAIALAKQHPDVVRAVVVGNEVLLRGEMTAEALAATLRRVKAEVPVPVTYADVWEFWLRYRELYPAVDFITVHILPYWEDLPVPAEEAATHVTSIRAKVAEAFPDKDILIGEMGWPSAGRMRESALPSRSNQARVLHDVLAAARAGNHRVNVIEAFDQPWKRSLEGTVGGYWGIFEDATRARKFAWGEPVSDHPRWPLLAAAGVLLAAGVLAAAWRGALPEKWIGHGRAWLAVAAIATVSGILFGWALEKTLLESLGVAGWARSLLLLAMAAAAPMLAAAALVRGIPMPTFARLLGGEDRRGVGRFEAALGGLFLVLTIVSIQTALAIAFDPRYRDFPFAQLGGAVVPFLLAALGLPRVRRTGSAAERTAAAVLCGSAVYVALNEGFANWQAQAFAALLLAQALSLLVLAGGRSRE